jgi:glutamate carboxypeptidase
MENLANIQRTLVSLQDDMLSDVERFVNMESGSRFKDDVDAVGRALAESFGELGFTVERIPQDDCGDHVIARRKGDGRGKLLALVHLDTVWPKGTLPENPFRVEENRAYGPGVGDMKGGWMILLYALRVLIESGWDGLEEVTVFMVGDEELGSPSARPHIEAEGRAADWCLVMEPVREDGSVVTERGMVGAVYFSVEGATAHTGAGDRGASAIEEMAHKVVHLQRLTDLSKGTIVSVGTFSGGTARQVVPDRADISIDVRAKTAADAEDVVSAIDEIGNRQFVAGTKTTITGGITRPAFERSEGTVQLLELAREAGSELGMTVTEAYTRAGSDGNFTAALGVPTLDGLGAEGFNICSRDEYILVDSLSRRAAILGGIMGKLGR